ncbi:MarR family winged helix-turn-helix transcriptional regulator [Lactiplantibacillus mudanjiangensis]|uniref:HTH marR-type domain-containing protein n=1 Tax=Lactiplantibacillus mudanjiangensis TaxID=1296538 RepID=A0A660E2U2_9LACO|nr:MarR family transcriptional regulator [Lactiplantibacillus mudanjiangensis]VDG24301.1 hypothetical protein [Lactobacillus allii] [Lactiplantibacillus mudanjiangensis]VDG30436.1 hypothetical protein [Lactobacillus allii] [Lactiplantibacillus mudanjiangensis]
MTYTASELNDLLRGILIDERQFFADQTKDLNITGQQARTLAYIEQHPGAIQRELAEAFKRRGASMSNMLKILERDGYIERRRSADNDRVKVLYLTELGHQTVAAVTSVLKASEDKLVENLSQQDIDELMTQLKKIKF